MIFRLKLYETIFTQVVKKIKQIKVFMYLLFGSFCCGRFPAESAGDSIEARLVVYSAEAK